MKTKMFTLFVALTLGLFAAKAQVWQKVESTSSQDLIEVQFMGDIGYALARNGQILYSADKGATWVKRTTVGMKAFDIQFVDDLTGYVLGNTEVFKTTDGAQSWKTVYSNPSPFALMHVFENEQLVVATAWGDHDRLYYTENDFDQVTEDTSSHFATSMTFKNRLEGHLNETHGGVLFTKDGGKTWRYGPHPLNGIWDVKEAIYLDEQTAILANNQRNYNLQNSKDTASYTWKESIDDEAAKSEFIYLNQLFMASNKDVYAVGYIGNDKRGFIAHTSDLAKTWILDTILEVELSSIAEVGTLDFVACGVSGAMYRTSEENSVDQKNVAQRISIWPNPVGQELRVEYTGGVRSLKLFQMDGTLVKSGFDTNSIVLADLPRGVYTIRVETESGFHTQRILKL